MCTADSTKCLLSSSFSSGVAEQTSSLSQPVPTAPGEHSCATTSCHVPAYVLTAAAAGYDSGAARCPTEFRRCTTSCSIAGQCRNPSLLLHFIQPLLVCVQCNCSVHISTAGTHDTCRKCQDTPATDPDMPCTHLVCSATCSWYFVPVGDPPLPSQAEMLVPPYDRAADATCRFVSHCETMPSAVAMIGAGSMTGQWYPPIVRFMPGRSKLPIESTSQTHLQSPNMPLIHGPALKCAMDLQWLTRQLELNCLDCGSCLLTSSRRLSSDYSPMRCQPIQAMSGTVAATHKATTWLAG